MTAPENIDAEVVIIGSGVAGAITACRLAEKGVKNIVVLEAGPRIDRAATVQNFMKSPYDDASSGYPNPAHAPRPDWNTGNAASSIVMTGPVATKTEYLRVVGGTTWHWAGSTPRLHPADFTLRKKYGVGYDWPFGYETLAPYYNEAEKELGVAGDSAFDDGSPRDMHFPMPPIPLSFCDRQISQGLPEIKFFFAPRCACQCCVSQSRAVRGFRVVHAHLSLRRAIHSRRPCGAGRKTRRARNRKCAR